METVCDRFKLSPFDVLRQYFDDVVNVWEGAVISADNDSNKNGSAAQGEQVYSYNSTWH